MESISLKKILPFELKEQINDFIFEHVGGREHQILYGRVFIPAIASEQDIVVDTVTRTVCESFGVPRDIVLSKTRKQPYMRYRQYITYFLFQYLSVSLSKIGSIVGCHHATILHTKKVVENYMFADNNKREEIKQLRNTLNVILWENK
ncbi:unnamed protein product [marine sediment metagenome]|uniref:Chromosomal replication initiator DnaA C-terminal domain-containing protein n=1 Tax=marine sediment metagenome TaxID=412755 RepID=X0WG52_9ZZZZ